MTTINGSDVGGRTLEEASKIVNNEEYLTIKKRDGKEEKINLKDIEYTSNSEDQLEKILNNQNLIFWPKYMLFNNNKEVTIKASYNKELLNKKVETLNMIINPTIQEPKNAYIESSDAGFQIVKEVTGNKINIDKLKNIIFENIDKQNMLIDLTNEDVYLKPEITAKSPEILKQLESYKKYEGLAVNVNFVNAQEKIDFNNFKNWLNFDEKGNMVFNDDKMIEQFKGYATKYNTFGSKRKFNATNIGQITVGGSNTDSYGFQLDTIKTIEEIKKALQSNGKIKDINAVWKIPALTRSEAGDIGNTYVEIDLTRQHLWYYVDGVLKLETDVVTGKDSTPTPIGVNRVWHKELNKTLVGEGYRQPVKYWMPFNWVNCGMHDTNYRRAFGGNIYKNSGSHGCVNMPPAKAKALYEMIKLDTPVIVYKS